MNAKTYYAQQDELWAVVRQNEARAKELRAQGRDVEADAAYDAAEEAYFDALAHRDEHRRRA